MTQKNKEKIKKICKRLYIIVTTIMSILFIVIAVIAGCGFSNNQQQHVNEQKEMTQNEVVKLPNNYLDDSNGLTLYGFEFLNYYVFDSIFNYYYTNNNTIHIALSGTYSYYYSGTRTPNFTYLHINKGYNDTIYSVFLNNSSNELSPSTYPKAYFSFAYINNTSSSSTLDIYHNSSNTIHSFYYVRLSNLPSDLKSQIKDYLNNGYSTGGSAPTYNTITLTNIFYPGDYPNRSFTYYVNTTYSTFGDWYNSGTSPLYLIDNSYYGWKGLGEIRYYYSNGWVNVTSNVSLSIQNLELQYYGSGYTQSDLNEQYSLGHDAGYDAGYDYGFEVGEQNGYNHAVSDLRQPIDLVLPSSTNFMYIYGDTYLEKYLPNVYFNRSLNDFYQSTYDFNDITFKVRGDQTHVFDTFRVNFGLISDYNYDISNTSTPVTYLAFVNDNVTLYDTYTDYSSFEGCTNYINLLIENVSASNFNQYYFVKSIQYIDSTNNYTLDVFNGVRTKGDMIYYTQNSSTGGGNLVATSVQHNGTYFVKNGWLNDTYRQLEVITYSETLMDVPNSNLNNMTFKEFLTYSYEKNMMLTNNVNDIYSLFSGAFGAIGGLLSVQVFPFISLGTLIFTPLIACIIMIIIKILKKG